MSAPKKKTMGHRNRRKSAKANAQKKAKHRRSRMRSSKGDRATYR